MATLPLILSLSDQLDDLALSPSPSYYGPNYGLGLYPQTVRIPLSAYIQDLQRSRQRPETARTVSNIGKDGFQVCMDVQQFKPSELTVKVVDKSVIVEGKHEEREDEHGYISRHFVRRYALPKDYDPDKLVSTLSSDGILTVSIPKPVKVDEKPREKIIQIQQTGPAHLNVKENPKDKSEEAAAPQKDASGDK